MPHSLLLVDDEPNILRALTRVLTEDDYKIYTATSGEEGLKILAQNAVEMVISDQNMPNMTGTEFLANVKKLYPNVIRIILSGHSDFQSLQKAINEGSIYKFFNKPWINEIIVEEVKQAITLVTEKNQQLFNLVYLDKITGTLNRVSFIQILENTLESVKYRNVSFAIVRIDIERFERINNELGHALGDTLLKLYAERIQAHLSTFDKVARIGSDEFILLIHDVSSKADLKKRLESLLLDLKKVVTINHFEVYVSSNIGICLYPDDTKELDDLINFSKYALQKAKLQGSNNYLFYSSTMSEPSKIMPLITLETELHKALNNHEFKLYYQPIVDKTGNIIELEALIRWHHPKKGFILPDYFLTLAEETGLIIEMGDWVIREACRQLTEWQNQGIMVNIALNLSAKQIYVPHFLEDVKTILLETKVNPSHLIFEVTESLIMDNIASAAIILNNLAQLGIKLSIDDFGTGYATLKNLADLPFNILKIDKSFINNVGLTENDGHNETLNKSQSKEQSKEQSNAKSKAQNMVAAIIAMSKSLGLVTVAEGVETKEQVDYLLKQNCDLLQGFYFSKALAVEEITEYLKKTKISIQRALIPIQPNQNNDNHKC